MRHAYLLAFSAIIMALGSACAVDHGAGVDDVELGLAASDEDLGIGMELDPGKWQAPPVKMKMSLDRSTLLAMVSLRNEVGACAGQMEHWFGTASALGATQQLLSTITLEATPLAAETESSIEAWASPFDLSFSSRREVRAGDWSNGLIAIPDDMSAKLYMTTHPDNDREYLGLLMAFDSTDALAFAGPGYRKPRRRTTPGRCSPRRPGAGRCGSSSATTGSRPRIRTSSSARTSVQSIGYVPLRGSSRPSRSCRRSRGASPSPFSGTRIAPLEDDGPRAGAWVA